MRRITRCLLAAVAALPLTMLNAPAADAYWTSGCEFGGTITFNPPLGTQPRSGTYVISGTTFCAGAQWGTGGVFPATDTWAATGTGTYTGNCTEATLSDGYTIMFVVGGAASVAYLTAPWNGAAVAVLTPLSGGCPLQPLSIARLNTVSVGTSYVP